MQTVIIILLAVAIIAISFVSFLLVRIRTRLAELRSELELVKNAVKSIESQGLQVSGLEWLKYEWKNGTLRIKGDLVTEGSISSGGISDESQ